jgi:hypothetical protein
MCLMLQPPPCSVAPSRRDPAADCIGGLPASALSVGAEPPIMEIRGCERVRAILSNFGTYAAIWRREL